MNNKNFSFFNFFDNCENQYQIKHKLLSFKYEDFCNKTHYLYYKLYVKPKVALIGKKYKVTYKKFYRNYDYKFYNNAILIVSNKYLVIEFTSDINGYYCYTRKSTYIIGYDNSNKLFVNKVLDLAKYTINENDLIKEFQDVKIYKTSDEKIKKELFDYDYDLDGIYEIVISDEGKYRIQGEVVISVENYLHKSINIQEYIYNSLLYDITRHTYILLTDFIALTIIELGFNIAITNRSTILLEDVIRYDNNEKMNKKLKALMNKIKEKLRDYVELVSEEENVQIFSNDYFGKFVIEYTLHPLEYGRKYCNVEISVRTATEGTRKVYEILKKEIKESIESIQKRDFSFAVGNHIINIKNAISLRLRITPKTQPLILNTNVLSLNARDYYVDNDTEITITHNEHGIAKIRFSKPFLINIRTTSINQEQALEINRVVMYDIYNNSNKNNNNKTLDSFI